MVIPACSALEVKYGRVVDEIRAEFPYNVGQELPCLIEGGTRESAITTGLLATQLATTLDSLSPSAVVTIADRHETLATSIAASYQNIPLVHIQGGEVSGSIDDKVRNANTALADVHCVSTERAAQNVRRIVPGAEVHVTGCPGIDLAAEAKALGPIENDYDAVVLQHPVTTEVDIAALEMKETIHAIGSLGLKILWFWPGEDAGTAQMSKELRLAGIHARRHMPTVEFLRTLMGAGCLVGNSSVGIRECSFLGVPVVNIGTRQNGRERGLNVVDVPNSAPEIRGAVLSIRGKKCPPSDLYGDGNAGLKIAQVLSEFH